MPNSTNKCLFSVGIKKPEFCIITPTAYLEQYATQSTTHLALAHLVDTDSAYREFYKQRSLLGDRIIMDCSAFELGESYAPDKLVALGLSIGANAVVLPDYPFQPAEKTINAAQQILPQVKDAGFASFFVPQSRTGDLEDWMDAYEWAAQEPDIDILGMSILGIPNALPHVPKTYARVVMSNIIKERGIVADKHHHYLGLNAGANVEIPALLSMGMLDTCDSSNPVWCGINGIMYNPTYSDWMGIEKKFLREVNFQEHYTNKTYIHDIIEYNVAMTLGLFA